MPTEWAARPRNPKFPWCAEVARRMLAEIAGCKPGDEIPPEAELLRVASAVAAKCDDGVERSKAQAALAMLGEIGGL
jgi:hypothetical protein